MKSILFSCCLISAMAVYGQKITVSAGPVLTPADVIRQMEVPKLKPVRMSDIVPTGHFFDIASQRTFTSFAFSKNNYMCSEGFINPVGAKAFSAEVLEADSKKVQVVNLLNHNDKLFIFYTTTDQQADQFSLYVNEVSKDLLVMGSPILIHKFSNVKNSGNYVTFHASTNKKYFLIYRYLETRGKEPQQFECTVIDSRFGEIWNKSFELPTRDKDFGIQSLHVDDLGNFYMLAEQKEKSESIPLVYFYNAASKALKNFPVGANDGYNFGTKLKIIDGTKPIIIGLNQQKKAVHYFVSKLNVSSGSLEAIATLPMPADFYKASNKYAFETKHWSVSGVATLANGDIVASVEARLVRTSNGSVVATYSYFTYLFSITPEGKQKYQHTIYKIQGGLGDFIGHTLIAAGNKAFVIYNDHPSNLTIEPSQPKVEGYTGKEAMGIVQEIDEYGKVVKYALSKDPGLDNFNLSIWDLTKLKDNLYFCSAVKRKNAFSLHDRNLILTLK